MTCLDAVVAEIECARFLPAEVRAALTDCANRCTPEVAFRVLLRAIRCAPPARARRRSITGGLPIHIGAALLGHLNLKTLQGYVAVFAEDVVTNYQRFLNHRRSLRPEIECAEVTPEEWADFEEHFDKRKVSIGTCARAFGTPCLHEHACVRCSLLRPDPAQWVRLVDIRDNLIARIAEAEREGWSSEVKGLRVSLAGAEEKLAQLERRCHKEADVDLDMPIIRSEDS
ncbi:integrase [Streptomyces sp. NPDC005281]|uniref:integrase n=1 Tax=Streptomyces sp. NPDC005281 TaxID=3155712 RepID=UPI00339FEA5B